MKIDLPEGIITPELVQVFEALKPHESRIVGGVVRDVLAGVAKDEPDIDICTTATPDVTTKKLEYAGIKAIPTGLEHGTVTGVVNGKAFEITTLRKDIRTDGRHAEVDFTDSFEEDAKRRDFTFNALYLNLDGTITDFFGGMKDLQDGLVRFVGDPETRIREDYLRLMRFFRFYARFGKVEPDKKLLELMANLAPNLDQLSHERITQEVMKLLQTPNPAASWRLMEESGILDVINLDGDDGQYSSIAALDHHTKLFPEARNPIERFVGLFGLYSGYVADNALLKLSNRHQKFIEDVTRTLNFHDTEHGSEDLLYEAGNHDVAAATLRILAAEASVGEEDVLRSTLIAQLDELEQVDIPTFPLSGKDVLEYGLVSGPMVGEILAQIEDWWQENGYPEETDCALQLKELMEKIR